MELRTLDRQGLREVYRTHVKRDFPLAERKPLVIMERLAKQGKYDTLGVYEGDELLAYAFLWHDERRDYALMDYLAVCEGGRGQGVGTAVLELLEEHYGDYLGILVEAEAIEPDASPEENALRLRRQEFYVRGGFQKLGHQVKLFTVVYDMFASGKADDAAAIATHRRLYCGEEYSGRKGLIEIPYLSN